MDPVASIRYSLHLGLREESPNLRVVAGTGERGRKKEKGRAGTDGEPCEHTCPLGLVSSQEPPDHIQALPEAGSPG